jgi:hypothetical protein
VLLAALDRDTEAAMWEPAREASNLMRAVLHEERGLRVPGRRVSRMFVVGVPADPNPKSRGVEQT